MKDWLYAKNDRDETTTFRERLYYRVSKELMKIRPEDYAKKISNGSRLDEDNPYGKYKVEKIKFVGSKIPDDGEEEE